MINLQPRIRAAVKAFIREHLAGAEIWAYGSRVTGRCHPGSDLDLVIRRAPGKSIRLGRIRELLTDSNIPILVDIHDWSRLPKSYQREIERAHVVL